MAGEVSGTGLVRVGAGWFGGGLVRAGSGSGWVGVGLGRVRAGPFSVLFDVWRLASVWGFRSVFVPFRFVAGLGLLFCFV